MRNISIFGVMLMLWESKTRANSNINQIIKKAIMKNPVSLFKAGIVILFLLVSNQNLLSQTMELIKLINSGTKFQVELTYDNGTLVGGKTYDVVYTNGEFSVTGYNNGKKAIGTWNYSNANPNASEISLWGAVYAFDGNGNIYTKDKGLSGKIITEGWISHISSGIPFKAKLDYDNGTLVAGKIYDVVYSNGEYAVTGYNNGTKAIGTWKYKNANPNLNEISLWGAIFRFDNDGILYGTNNNKFGVIYK